MNDIDYLQKMEQVIRTSPRKESNGILVVEITDDTATAWCEFLRGLKSRPTPLRPRKSGIYCKLCECHVQFDEMKPWQKDDDTVDMLCPGCDSVLVEGE
jgi:hypothetical protein